MVQICVRDAEVDLVEETVLILQGASRYCCGQVQRHELLRQFRWRRKEPLILMVSSNILKV